MTPLDLEQRILEEYAKGDYGLGWRFLYSPVNVLDGADVAFIGSNPGGCSAEPERDGFCTIQGSAFETERWKNLEPGLENLQRQAKSLFEALDAKAENVLAGNLVPFRSPGWAELPRKEEAVSLGRSLWAVILATTKPNLVVTHGRPARENISDILGINLEHEIDAQWNGEKIYYGSNDKCRVVGLPHLSRYPVIGRVKNLAALNQAFQSDAFVCRRQ